MVRVGVDALLDEIFLKDFTKSVELTRIPEEPLHAVDVDFWIAPFSLEALARQLPYLRGLKVVQCLWAGVDTLLPLLPAGLTLCDARGVHDIPAAEWMAAAILAMEKYLPLYAGLQANEDWDGRSGIEKIHRGMYGIGPRPTPVLVDELAGKTVLIVGYGSIGQALEARLEPFGCNFLRVARTSRPGVETVGHLDKFLSEADIVACLLPLTPETKHLISAERIGKMKHGALLVNVGRGQVIETDALVKALRDHRIRAALDVTDPEPLPPGHPLWKAPNVFITPHIGGSTANFIGRAMKLASQQAERFANGEPLQNVVSYGY